MNFANPSYLFLLLALIPIIGWYIYKMHKADASIQMPSAAPFKRSPHSWRIYLRHIPFVMRVAAIVLLIIALARPQLSNSWSTQTTEGIDIMMAMDISGTMLTEDLKPNRLDAAKEVATEFIANRPNDQIGLVIFAGESFTQCPLTTDHVSLNNLFNAVEFGMVEDGTAIGMGLANAVNRIKDSKAVSKVIILLTDGSNNCGDIAPETAAQIAQTMGIRVYAIGVGSHEEARMPVQTAYGMRYITVKPEFDEETLKMIANTTGGQYFRATDNESLRTIYQEIDQMEKTKLHVQQFHKHIDNYQQFVLYALICLVIGILLRYTVLRTISN